MTQNLQLPAHLANRQTRGLAQRAVAGLGALLPPHISIQGNVFTLIDAAGNEQPRGNTLDCCIIDVSDVNCKKYFAKKWEPNSNDPPDCWSANGVAPSRDAVSPQANTCAECQWNKRGSAVSAISGAAIKACRDEKWLALLLPQYPAMLFQLVLTPGSFDNWRTYIKRFENQGFDVDFVVTRISFEPKVNGVLEFQMVQYVDEKVAQITDAARAENKTDVLVGRNDVPRLAPPVPTTMLAPVTAIPATMPLQPQSGFSPVPAAAPMAQPTMAAQSAATGQTAEQPRTRRRRNTAQQPEQPQMQPVAPATSPQPNGPAMAPFRQAAAAAPAPNGPANPQPQFGMQQGVAPNAEIEGALNSVFGQQ